MAKKARALVIAEGAHHPLGGLLAAALARDAQGRPSLRPEAEAQAAAALDLLEGLELAEAVDQVLELAQLVERELGAPRIARRLVALVRAPSIASRLASAWDAGVCPSVPSESLEASPDIGAPADAGRAEAAPRAPAPNGPAASTGIDASASEPEPTAPDERVAGPTQPRGRGPASRGDLSLTLRHPRRV
jgi:hypothetical protein